MPISTGMCAVVVVIWNIMLTSATKTGRNGWKKNYRRNLWIQTSFEPGLSDKDQPICLLNHATYRRRPKFIRFKYRLN